VPTVAIQFFLPFHQLVVVEAAQTAEVLDKQAALAAAVETTVLVAAQEILVDIHP
jgi:hypothetical protein